MDVALDTDILILLSKLKKLDELVSRYNVYITIITEYEYVRGEVIAGVDSSISKSTLEEAFGILFFDNKSVKVASVIWSEMMKKKEFLDERDLIIGAICIANNIPLWTGNIKHFKKLKEYGLNLVTIDTKTWSIKEP